MDPTRKKRLLSLACVLLCFVRGLALAYVSEDSPLAWAVDVPFFLCFFSLCMSWLLTDAALQGIAFKDSLDRVLLASVFLCFPFYFYRTRGKAWWKPTLLVVGFLVLCVFVLFCGGVIPILMGWPGAA